MAELRLPPLTRTQNLSPIRQPNARPMNLRQDSRDSEIFREVRRVLRKEPEVESVQTVPDPGWILALENLFHHVGERWHRFCVRMKARLRGD